MAQQTQTSGFAKKLGQRVAEAHDQHKDAPIEIGNRKLPPGIVGAIAKIQLLQTRKQEEEGKKIPKGEWYFYGQAVVVYPREFKGNKIANLHTFMQIPLCDMPATQWKAAVPFSLNWKDFQNFFKWFGIIPPLETRQTDPTGQRIESYYQAAMKILTDPQREPRYIYFDTWGFTPKPTQANPNPDTILQQKWTGPAKLEDVMRLIAAPDPAAGVTVTEPPPPDDQTEVFTEPPQDGMVHEEVQQPSPDDSDADLAGEVAALVEVAMNDPEGSTQDGATASARLEELAWAQGWTREQTGNAKSWRAVGEMALTSPQEESNASTNGQVTVGSRWLFARRNKEGNKLSDNKGVPFPAQEVEVTAVNEEEQTCTVKTVKDGKDVIELRSKKPVVVRFDWLE